MRTSIVASYQYMKESKANVKIKIFNNTTNNISLRRGLNPIYVRLFAGTIRMLRATMNV